MLAEMLVCQLRAILNSFNYCCFKCNQQANRHTFAYYVLVLGNELVHWEKKKMLSCFSLEFIVVLK